MQNNFKFGENLKHFGELGFANRITVELMTKYTDMLRFRPRIRGRILILLRFRIRMQFVKRLNRICNHMIHIIVAHNKTQGQDIQYAEVLTEYWTS